MDGIEEDVIDGSGVGLVVGFCEGNTDGKDVGT